uniref:PH domain-containing protein n=1 Tax=Macrostomum lignano TaxID=282301 RepID=A0A1I8GJ01_9PLAT
LPSRTLGHNGGTRRKRDSGIGRDSSFEESTASPNNSGGGGGNASGRGGGAGGGGRGAANVGGAAGPRAGDSDSGLSEVSGSGQLGRGGRRRRTMPSLLSSPPVRPATVAHSTLEEIAHSAENLKNSTFIIENGIRKRVHAESRPCLVTDPASKLTRACASTTPADPERLAPLPRHYRIESQAKLAKDLGEGSLPDVSVCRHIRRHGGVMSRDEVARLSEARRLELLRLEERRRQGEIVIRMADLKPAEARHLWIEAIKLLAAATLRTCRIAADFLKLEAKDWCQEHLLLVFVFVINTGLAMLFFSLLTSEKTDT